MPCSGCETGEGLGQTMKSFGEPKANIVTMVLVAGPGIAEPHDELNGRRQVTLNSLSGLSGLTARCCRIVGR